MRQHASRALVIATTLLVVVVGIAEAQPKKAKVPPKPSLAKVHQVAVTASKTRLLTDKGIPSDTAKQRYSIKRIEPCTDDKYGLQCAMIVESEYKETGPNPPDCSLVEYNFVVHVNESSAHRAPYRNGIGPVYLKWKKGWIFEVGIFNGYVISECDGSPVAPPPSA